MSNKSGGFILENDAIAYLEQFNIPYPNCGFATSGDDAVQIADKLGYPVVLKVVSPDISHKSDTGGVILNLSKPDDVKNGYVTLIERVISSVPGADIKGALVCSQAQDGLEVIVGAINDSVFGSTVMFGLGGIYTEVLRDVVFRVAPLKHIDADEMIREIKGYPILEGLRGQVACDIDALIELIMSVSRLVTEVNEIRELDLNPVRLYERGLLALDVRIFCQPPD